MYFHRPPGLRSLSPHGHETSILKEPGATPVRRFSLRQDPHRVWPQAAARPDQKLRAQQASQTC